MGSAPAPKLRPPWLVKRLPARAETPVPGLLDDLDLNTVCRSAKCPNLPECWPRKTATLMILGTHCTRSCRFCAVEGGVPSPVEPDEPARVAEAARRLGLSFVVVTSVTRDDLPDGGAAHFAATVRAVHETGAKVEVLVPDFGPNAGPREASVRVVMASAPEVFGHNVETVPRLYPAVRPGADYARSLAVLDAAARSGRASGACTVAKSGLMVGLGETPEEVERVLRDLRAAGCEAVTLGQYLSPSPSHVPVAEYVAPARFDEYASLARGLGFAAVAAGPFVRSSYRAADIWRRARLAGQHAGG